MLGLSKKQNPPNKSFTPMVPNLSSFTEDSFSTGQGRNGDGFGMTQAYHMYCACYFYYFSASLQIIRH